MTIAKKYEDVVVERDAALAREAEVGRLYDSLVKRSNRERDASEKREAALREELGMVRKAVPNSTRELLSLQQRLAVAEQRIGELESILGRLIKDCLASDFNEHWDSFISAESALKPAAPHQGEPVVCVELVENKINGGMHIVKWDNLGKLKEGIHKLYAEQPAPVAKSRCEQVPFSMLCYGAKFKYTPGESAVFVKIGPDLVAGWDGQKVADGWIGQPVCSFSDDGNLLAVVTLVHERPAPVAVVMPEILHQTIRDTLRNYRMSTLDDGHGGGYPLIDAMTADGQPVSGGIEECQYLADAILNACIDEVSRLNGVKP